MHSEALQADSAQEAESMEQKRSLSESAQTAIAAVVVVAIIVAVFWKTVFRGVPISALYLVAHWDSLFAAFRQGAPQPIDPSGLLESVPYYTMCVQQFHAGMWPLWNHLNAFGIPLCGDLQATVFSPLRLLFDVFPCAYTYNLQLVLQVLVCSLGTFALSRTLGAGRLASVFAAVCFGLSPFMLWYLELQSGVAFVEYPLVMWLFARAAKSGRNGDAVWAGMGSGVSLLIGHPEPAFFGTLLASTLMALIAVPVYGVLGFVRLLVVAGVSAICTAAPTLFPFLEFMRNADCYKFGVSNAVSMPWQALACNLLTPLSAGASPFLGVLALALVVPAFQGERRSTAIKVAIVCALAAIPAANLWPFSLLSKHPPFSYLITVYFTPIFLLCLSTLAAIGITNLGEALERPAPPGTCTGGRKPAFGVALVLLLTITIPILLHALHVNLSVANFDVQLPASGFSIKGWQRDAVLGAVFLLSLAALFLRWPPKALPGPSVSTGISIALLALVLNFISVASVAKSSLPTCPPFAFENLKVTTFLKDSQERCLAMTAHILKPNINVLYGIEDIRAMNVMWPKRYLKFVTACGAVCDQYNQIYDGPLSSLIDLGSVRYVLSQSPVICKEDQPLPMTSCNLVSLPCRIADGLTIDKAATWCDPENAAAGGYLTFSQTPAELAKSHLKLVFVLLSAHGHVLWFSDRISPVNAQKFTVALPVDGDQNCTLVLRLFDPRTGQFIPIAGGLDQLSLTAIDSAVISHPRHFALKRWYPETQVRVYENGSSLPHAYLCFDKKFVDGEDAAFKSITSDTFDAHHQVVLETTGTAAVQSNSSPVVPATIAARQPAQTAIDFHAHSPGWLVLTDTFYPGWNAYLDGYRVPIIRANYLFRAIAAPSGNHRAVFKYEPITFYAGLLTFFSFLGVVLVFATVRRRTS